MNEKQFATGGIVDLSKFGMIGNAGLLDSHECDFGRIVIGDRVKELLTERACKNGVSLAIVDVKGYEPRFSLIDVSDTTIQARGHIESMRKRLEKHIEECFLIPDVLPKLKIEVPPLHTPEGCGLTRYSNSEFNMRYGIYLENVNNCFIAVYQIVVYGRYVTFELIRKIRFCVFQFVKVKTASLSPARFFSGFKSNGLRHWFQGKGRRRRK